MTQLPVNATSEAKARAIASDAARTQVPAGFTLQVGNLVATEPKARPFNRVALEEHGVPASRMQTYVFEVAVRRTHEGA